MVNVPLINADTANFIKAGYAFFDGFDAGVKYREHAVLAGAIFDLSGIRAFGDQRPDRIINDQNFRDNDPSLYPVFLHSSHPLAR